jgi:geranylgeranyl reductase family protein
MQTRRYNPCNMIDVTVVGAGPGGLVTGARLAAAGHRVLVLEEHDVIGAPVHCTGVLAHDAVEDLDLPRSAILNPLSTVRFVAPSGASFAYTTSRTEAIVIDRLAFDAALANRAAAAGAEIRRGCRVQSLETDAEGVTALLPDGATVRSRAVVLACGANYRFQRAAGLGMPSTFLQSAQLELPVDSPGDVEMHFGSAIAPRGFAWAVPVCRPEGSFARIGVMAAHDPSRYFERMVERITPAWGVRRPADATPRRRMLPLGATDRSYADRTLAVGDAAGLVKPTTGGGIYYSMVSGEIAADVLTAQLAADDLSASALAVYEQRCRARFHTEFTAQLALRVVAERMSDADIDALFSLAHTDGILPLVRRTARFNQHRDFIVALFRHRQARRLLFNRFAPALAP